MGVLEKGLTHYPNTSQLLKEINDNSNVIHNLSEIESLLNISFLTRIITRRELAQALNEILTLI